MYILKENAITFENQKQVAEEIGICESTLSRVLSSKQAISKLMAYCITKYYNNNAEILEYFIKEK